MQVEQFVMAYGVEQDRVRALLPPGFESLRPVLRINAEIRDEKTVYAELNAPVERDGKRGWLNIANWNSGSDEISFARREKTVTISAPFLRLAYTGIGMEGGCPAERDNSGCFYRSETGWEFKPVETINSNKEFCDCEFAWRFHPDDAHGVSAGKTLPAFHEEIATEYEKKRLTAENAAAIPCRQVLGAYIVRFERNESPDGPTTRHSG